MRSQATYSLTTGERSLALAYVAMAGVSAFVAFVVSIQIGRGGLFLREAVVYDLWLLMAGALGGVGALRLVRDRLGHPGWRGVGDSMIAGLYATFLAGLIGGTLALPLYGTMFGPFTLGVTLIGSPALLMMWITVFVMAHVQARHWQRERNSIFMVRLTT